MSVMKAFRLDGRVAMVVGGARTLGFDMADALAEAGADLIITSRSLESASEAAEKLKEAHGRDVLPLALDHTDENIVVEVFDKARGWKGRLDVVVNNAGGTIGSNRHLFERDPDHVRQVINVNVNGVLFCCQAAAKIMAKQGHGKIINVGSIAGMVGRDRRIYDRNNMDGQPIDYAAAKAGVIGMTRDLAGLLGPMNIHVNCISPGGFARQQPGNFERDYSDQTPLGRMGRDGSNDLKGPVVFLASDASDYVTGLNLVVDGGFWFWK